MYYYYWFHLFSSQVEQLFDLRSNFPMESKDNGDSVASSLPPQLAPIRRPSLGNIAKQFSVMKMTDGNPIPKFSRNGSMQFPPPMLQTSPNAEPPSEGSSSIVFLSALPEKHRFSKPPRAPSSRLMQVVDNSAIAVQAPLPIPTQNRLPLSLSHQASSSVVSLTPLPQPAPQPAPQPTMKSSIRRLPSLENQLNGRPVTLNQQPRGEPASRVRFDGADVEEKEDEEEETGSRVDMPWLREPLVPVDGENTSMICNYLLPIHSVCFFILLLLFLILFFFSGLANYYYFYFYFFYFVQILTSIFQLWPHTIRCWRKMSRSTNDMCSTMIGR